ncbi:dual specificity protein phosphatase MPK-4-like [Belonocnema kinseyi]|uniref:dual specificity protein phosphatase MPK-4-like n=1 Tax=Belonocnema kinseyi TaxID=2817044 RepID=UPI00143D8AE9|nr:dual specificity protein phosphatase MPK-4-like [Belonocnema kinseyi]XP_033229284.1 dual specificity protein phosphatase MPK-4-like [Belonocnema kinseyi]
MAHQETNDLTREDFDAGPSSYNEIEPNLYLGNLTAATDVEWLKQAQITYILTVDSCPLPRKIQCLPDVTLKYIQVTDMPREDLLTYFEDTYQFILYALERGGKVLVHCYFGVSRSATLIIAYMMKKYNMSFSKAFEAVKQKRRFVGPNPGFIAQLKLYEHMDFSINNNNIQFKLYRLQVAADNVRKAKILPQNHMDLIRSDPGLATVRPEPTVYRCKKCRRIVANASNILPHAPKEQQIWRHVSTKRHDKPPKQIKCLQMPESATQEEQKTAEICMKTYFIEPLAWMPEITHNVEGKLNCPKCNSKLGAFSWISGCQCPCGSKIAPAFYLVPSKVDWSNVVQNVQSTI